MKTLYQEQTEARHISNRFLNSKIHSVFVSPCGTGKTVTASAIITDRVKLEKRVFILVPQIEIMNQWIDELSEWGLNPGYCNDEGFRGNNRAVYVCMYQSLIGKLQHLPESIYPDEIFIDETQHMLCSSIMDICTYFEGATRIGLTATLYHNSKQSFRPWYDDFFQTITKKQAIENGYVTESILIEPEDYLKDKEIPSLGEEYDMEKQAKLLGETKIYGNMLEDYERLFTGRPIIVPCATYEQAKQIKKMFNDAGWRFEHVHSEKMSKHERKRILSDVANQKCNGLTTVGIGVEGLSIKGLWGVMWACRTKSPIKWTQFNGRGERIYPGKNFCLVVDYVGNAIIHGHPSDERKWNLEGIEVEEDDEDKVPFKKCWSCGTYNNPENSECHWCGADLTADGPVHVCKTCGWWIKDEDGGWCSRGEAIITVQRASTIPGYCKHWKSRGRKLPAIVDGKLIAITTDGQRQEIQERIDAKKEEIQEAKEKEAAKKNRAEKISSVEKRKALQAGLFASTNRKSLFQEALNK